MSAGTGDFSQAVVPYIDGTLSTSESGARVDVIDPSNGQRCVSIPAGCAADADRAVASARWAFEDGRWRGTSPSFRARTLHRLADLIGELAATLDALDAEEMGKPISEPRGNAVAAAGLARFCAEAIDKIMGDVCTTDESSLVLQRRVPRGVVAGIAPWNFPTYNAVLKTVPALAAGNSVVLKPSEMSSRSAIKIAHLAMEAGLPPGVLNVVPGLGETVGQALALHMDVDMVSFTGSTEVGKLMLQYSGRSNMKVVMAECGGKSPQIVFADADLDAAAEHIVRSLLTNQGQICTMGSRLLVQRSVESEIIERVVSRLGRIVIGNAMDPKTTYGPIASASQCKRVMQYIERARAEGCKLVAGGRRVLLESGGFFVQPTVFCNVSPGASVAQEEVFGPVLSVIPFREEVDAIRIANDTIYGLSAYVWTGDLATGMRMMQRIRSSVSICTGRTNGGGAGFVGASEPFRQSGIGTEGGLAGMESYLRRQQVSFNYN